MFPLKPREELVFGISNNTPISQNIFLNFDQLCTSSSSSSTISFGSSSSTTTTTTIQPRDGATSGKDDIEMRRVVHRNIERQRRQEMSQLFDSLRSFLPLEHIKGRRSLSDIMHASKNYIKDLEKNVQELRVRRKNLKKASISSRAEICSSNGKDILRNYVEVNKDQNGIEILITNGPELISMSHVMIELMSSELDVVNCVSTKINGRFLHKIQAQARDLKLVDLSRLQERLTCVVNL